MHCTRVKVGTTTAIVCGSRRRLRQCSCGAPATRLCDWIITRVSKRVSRTCSAPICDGCTTTPVEGKDLCRTHADAWAQHPRNPEAARRP